MEGETMGRIMQMFFGLFLFFFGLPFTLTPFMILGDGVIDPAYPFESLFIIVFTTLINQYLFFDYQTL